MWVTSLFRVQSLAVRIFPLAACLLAATGSDATMRRDDPVVAWEARLGSWTFSAAHDERGLRGLLAHCDPQAAVGDNIRMIWFPIAADLAPGPLAWKTLDPDAGVNRLAGAGIVTDTAWFSRLGGESPTIDAPEPMASGLTLSDPLVEFVRSESQPEVVVEYLAAIGVGAAPSLSSMVVASELAQADPNNPVVGVPSMTQVLLMLQHDAEVALFGQSSTPEEAILGYCAGCTKVTTPTVLSAWNCVRILIGSSEHCVCKRTETRCHQYSGLEFIGCDPCPLNNYCETRTQTADTTILPGAPCPPAGGPGTTWPWGPWEPVP